MAAFLCRVLRFMVTNEKFAEFVGNTSYETDSEKYGWSFVFLPMLSERQQLEIRQVCTHSPHFVLSKQKGYSRH